MVKIIPISKRLISLDKGTISRKRSIAYFQTEVDTMYSKFATTQNSNKRKVFYGIANSTNTGDILKPSIDKGYLSFSHIP